MTEIFLNIVNMSITASILAVVVLLLRFVLQRAPKWISVLLWGLVAFRLICPFTVESPFSLIPETDWTRQETLTDENLFLNSVSSDSISFVDFSSFGDDVTVHYYPLENPAIEIHRGVSTAFILACVWCAGMAVLLLHTVLSTVRLRRSIGAAIRVRDNVWESSAVDSPFVLGILRPRIYIPRGMRGESLNYVIAHEQSHIRRKDHWWKPLGFLLLTIHWFNPVMWLAYILLCRDIEMACDEKVVRDMGEAERTDYSEALLECSVKRSMISACPLAFGEVGVKERIKTVLNYKKPAFWIVVLAVIACAVAAVCFLTNPVEDSQEYQDRYTLEIQAENVAEIQISTPGSSGGVIQADHSVFPVGEKVWLEQLDNVYDLHGVSVTALAEDGTVLYNFSVPVWMGHAEILAILEEDTWLTVPEEVLDGIRSDAQLTEGFCLQGRYAQLSGGRHIMILTEESREIYNTEYLVLNPVAYSGETVSITGYRTGDLIVARGMTIAELYPPIFDINEIYLISRGTVEDIPENMWDMLDIVASAEAEKQKIESMIEKLHQKRMEALEYAATADFVEFTAVITDLFVGDSGDSLLYLNIVEFITREDTERIAELGLPEQDMISGYYIYDEDDSGTAIKLPADTEFIFYDWRDAYADETDERYEILGDRWVSTRDAKLFYEYWLPYKDAGAPGYPFVFTASEDSVVIKEIPLM